MNDAAGRPRIVYAITSSLGLGFLRGQVNYLSEAGYDVTVISSLDDSLAPPSALSGTQNVYLSMRREISPLRDLVALWRLWRTLRRLRPSITNVSTPKAGFLGGLAAALAGVPCRIYTLRGLRCETLTGIRRRLLLFTETIACRCAHRVVSVSHSLCHRAVSLGVVNLDKITVLASGSSNGVDAPRFDLDRTKARQVVELKRELGIPQHVPVVGFAGRFARDKGIAELLEASTLLRTRFPELRLLLLGDFEEGDPPIPAIRKRIKTDPNIISPGFVADPALYYHIMDVLALPTHREGFPNVVLEANASGKPAVATNATGAVDSVLDGVTGFVVGVGDSAALADRLTRLLDDPVLAATMGKNGKKRVLAKFQPKQIWAELLTEYQSLLQARGLRVPDPSLHATDLAQVCRTGSVSS
jgi:glycosyltransferase involved in cell wall biosynthesis